MLVKSLLCDLELLQSKGLGFKFFLWDKLEPYYREFARPDRIQQFTLSWNETELNTMLSRRLGAFSAGQVNDLGQLTNAALAKPLQFLVVLFANGSPRDMIRICQDILSEQLQLDPGSERVGLAAIEQGIGKFARQRTRELLPEQIVKELSKVGRVDFTTNLVANDIFKIEVNSARNKINSWIQTGTVEKVGELHTGTRPIHQYALTDIRVAATVCSQLDLIDFLSTKSLRCTKCRALILRDWDSNPMHTCQSCGADNHWVPRV